MENDKMLGYLDEAAERIKKAITVEVNRYEYVDEAAHALAELALAKAELLKTHF